MRIHILGANGFVGQRLQEFFFQQKDFETKGYSSSDCNLLFPHSVSLTLSPFTKKDVVIMASSITRLRENTLESMIKNVRMADNMSKFIHENPPAYFVFLSTTDVYGVNPQIPITENNLPHPNDYYSLSKLSSEFLFKKICSEKQIPLLILRLSGLYGKGDEGKSIISKLLESAVKERKITVIGDGNDKRDPVYVEDIGKIIFDGITQKTDSLINVATGESYSIKQIVEFLRDYLPYKVSVEYKESLEDQKRAREMQFDTSLLRKNFPEFKFTNLKQGLKLYLQERT